MFRKFVSLRSKSDRGSGPILRGKYGYIGRITLGSDASPRSGSGRRRTSPTTNGGSSVPNELVLLWVRLHCYKSFGTFVNGG